MSLIYAREAWERFGVPLTVRDAKGRKLTRVVACNPLTGEVIDRRTARRHWFAPAPLTIERDAA